MGMGKRNNSIIISAVLVAFLVGTIFSSPNYANALPPWANDIILSIENIVTGVAPVNLESTSTIGGLPISTGDHTTDTNAGTQCTAGQYLDGDGTCKAATTSGISGTCNQGSFLVGINSDGSVICESLKFYTVSVTSTTTDNIVAQCDSGDVAISGGGHGINNQDLRTSRPISSVWQAVTNGIGVTAYAVCLDNFPAHIP